MSNRRFPTNFVLPAVAIAALVGGLVATPALAADAGAASTQPLSKHKGPIQQEKPVRSQADALFVSMPYAFVGRVAEENGAASVVLSLNGMSWVASAGSVLEKTYRIEAVLPDAMEVTYLPSGTKRTVLFSELTGQASGATITPTAQSREANAGVVDTAPARPTPQTRETITIVADENFNPSTFTAPPGVIVNVRPPPPAE